MTPPKHETREEERAKQGLGEFAWYLLKHRFTWPLVFGGAAVFGWTRPVHPQMEFRQVIREELRPIEAGLKALAERAPDKTRIAVLEAMAQARQNHGDAN